MPFIVYEAVLIGGESVARLVLVRLSSTVTRTRATRRPSILPTLSRTPSTSTASPTRGSRPSRAIRQPATVS